MAKTQKNAQKQTTAEQKQKRQQKQSQKQSKELTVRLSELTEEQFKDVLTEAVQTAEAELKAEAEQKKAEQKQTTEEQKQTEAQQTAEAEEQTEAETEQTAEAQRIERTVTDRDFAELKAVAQTFKIRDNGFLLYIESQKQLETADGEGTDNSVLIGRYGFGSNGKGELVSVWCRRKATDRKAVMYADWISNGQKKSTEKQKHAFPCDFGLRFSQDDFKMFMDVAEAKAVIDSFDVKHAEVKHNEPRFSFPTLSAVTKALAKLYNAYESAEQTAEQTGATKEAEAQEQEQKKA